MAQMNRVSTSIPAGNITAIKTALQTIQTNLPFLVGLSDHDREIMPKMADKGGFHDKCLGYMGSNPEFLPGFVAKAEVDKDQTLRDEFMQFWPLYQTLSRSVEDTLMVLESELWMADLAYYQSVREAASRSVAGAQAIYDDLRGRFPGHPGKKKTP
jgi:hypothetical protein